MATPVRWGNEFLVNTTTSGVQYDPYVTALSNGRFVVSWTDWSTTGGDTSFTATRAQVFDADGTPRGSEFLVNSTTHDFQNASCISALAGGRFVVVFSDGSSSGGDPSGQAVRAQIYNADGSRAGGEILINSTVAGDQKYPGTVGLTNGRFVVSWTDDSGRWGDTSSSSIRAQLFNADGTKAGAEFQVNTTTEGYQSQSRLTALIDGRFVVTWSDGSATGGDTALFGIRAQIFNANGSASGGEFLVNTATAGNQAYESITALAGGGFVITWTDTGLNPGDTSSGAVRAQVFNATGGALGAEFLVNTTTLSDQSGPNIAALRDGRFVVVWTDSSATGGDTSDAAVRGQLFNANGTKSGAEFLVNTTTLDFQISPSVTTLADGRFVVSWQDASETGGDTTAAAVRSQIFDPREAAVTLPGSAVADDLIGTRFGDVMHGALGFDRLTGGLGNDSLFGDAGNDLLRGGAGADMLTGGAGADRFVFIKGGGNDRITDFADGSDRIDLATFNFAGFAAAKAHFTAQGDDVVFTFGADRLVVLDMTLAQITAGDLFL